MTLKKAAIAPVLTMPKSTEALPQPSPYHQAIVQHFQREEPGLWSWFTSTRKRAEAADAVRLDLLKSTYRLEAALHPQLYDLAHEIAGRMDLKIAVTFYQAQTGMALNAALAYVPGEAHVILAGPLVETISAAELQAVLAHELAHFQLFDGWDGAYFTSAEVLRALSADASARPAYSESARLYNLWTEIYADRWACHLGADMTAAISALIKVSTGLSEVSADSYLRQADEIFAKSRTQANQLTHPEPYIRARALRLWHEQGDEAHAEIERMIEGPLHLGGLDLLGQKKLAEATREFLHLLLTPGWFQTDAVLGHAKRFFPDFQPAAVTITDAGWREVFERADASVPDYFCYLMLDFATVDRDLGDVAIAATLVLSRRLAVAERFGELAQKELGLGKKAFARIDKDAEALLAGTEASTQP